MFGPRKNILWFAKHTTLPLNPYPFFQTRNLSIGGEASNLAVFVPLLLGQKNVKEVVKKEGDESKGGKNLSLKSAADIRGSGAAAFLHPVKVQNKFFKSYFI